MGLKNPGIGARALVCYTWQAMSYSVTRESFANLEKPWQDLLPASATNHIFLTPQWQRAWWQAFGGGSQLSLLSVWRNTELMGVIPLRQHGEVLTFIGDGDVCDYMDVIARRGHEVAILSPVLDYLETMDWHAIDLWSLRPQSTALAHFAPLARQRGYLVKITKVDVSPEVTLPSSWPEYLSRLKKKDRHELRRKLRRLDRVKSTRFYTVTDNGQLSQGLESFFELFQLSRGNKAAFMSPQRREFFKTMVHSLAEKGYIRLSFLEVDSVPVASALCFDYGNELYLYNSAYNPAYASLSAGLMVKVFCLREGITEGKRRFDLLRGDEPYKYDLGGQEVPIYRCVISRE